MAIEAYCVKCKAKKIMKDPVEGVTKNGKPITKGKCPDCGTTLQNSISFEQQPTMPALRGHCWF